MRNETPQNASNRTLLLRELGGQNNARPTDKSDNTFYLLENLRPDRGSLVQPRLLTELFEIVES